MYLYAPCPNANGPGGQLALCNLQRRGSLPRNSAFQPMQARQLASENDAVVRGWAQATHFVFSLLWHSRILIPETALFDEDHVEQDHLFVSFNHKHDSTGDCNVSATQAETVHLVSEREEWDHTGRVLRMSRKKTTLPHFVQRLRRKARAQKSPLCAVYRQVATHGNVLSAPGLEVCAQTLQEFAADALAAGHGRVAETDDEKPVYQRDNFCVQEYIEPEGGLRYEVTLQRGSVPDAPQISEGADKATAQKIEIDVVPSLYASSYVFPDNYPPQVSRQRDVHPPSQELRERICTMAVSIVRYAEVTHDMWIRNMTMEMVCCKQAESKVYLTGVKEVAWLHAPGVWQMNLAPPIPVKGHGVASQQEIEAKQESELTCGNLGATAETDSGGEAAGGPKRRIIRPASASLLPTQSAFLTRRDVRGPGLKYSASAGPTLFSAGAPLRPAFGPSQAHPSDTKSSIEVQRMNSVDQSGDVDTRKFAEGGDSAPGGNRGQVLTNIRIARNGRDDLHVKLSTELRRAYAAQAKQQKHLGALKARDEGRMAQIAGLEALNTRTQQTLKATEAELETHRIDSMERIQQLERMLKDTQEQLTASISDVKRERALRAQLQLQKEHSATVIENLEAQNAQLLKRLSVVADFEENGLRHTQRLKQLEDDHTRLRSSHKILLSESEELRHRLGMTEEALQKQRAFRDALFALMADVTSRGVRPPERMGGGYSVYPYPCKANVKKAVKMLVDGNLRSPSLRRLRRPRSAGHFRLLGEMRRARKALAQQPTGASTVDTPSLFRQLRAAMKHRRSLYGRTFTSPQTLFEAIDRDGDGCVTPEELDSGLHRLDVGLSKSQIRTVVTSVDIDESGNISVAEFTAAFAKFAPEKLRRRSPSPKISR